MASFEVSTDVELRGSLIVGIGGFSGVAKAGAMSCVCGCRGLLDGLSDGE